MPETITSLIEKLEGAEVGSTKLDCYVGLWARTDGNGEIVIVSDKYVIKDAGGTYAAQPYTTSLDAALALAERVMSEDEALFWLNQVVYRADQDTVNGTVRGLPLKLCAAILRAQSEARV